MTLTNLVLRVGSESDGSHHLLSLFDSEAFINVEDRLLPVSVPGLGCCMTTT